MESRSSISTSFTPSLCLFIQSCILFHHCLLALQYSTTVERAGSAQNGSPPKWNNHSLPIDHSSEGMELTDTDADSNPESDTKNI